MTYEEALNKIHSLLTFGSRPGLDRIKQLLRLMGNPQDTLKFIHVAGTNGKGSVCAMLSAVLTDAGYKTGLFISPYITDFRERIQINGEMISKTCLTEAVEATFPLVERLKREDCIITEFEYVMALEFYIHKKENCDLVVLETGMGGLLDCTNVILPPLCSVLTTIGLDHTAILGNTIEEITKQKCGIVKSNSIAVTSEQEPKAWEIILHTAQEKKIPLYKSRDISISVLSQTVEKTVFMYRGLPVTLRLPGAHQLENAKTALAALEALRGSKLLSFSDQNIQSGFYKAVNPARFEILSKTPLVILDGAHNPNGIQALKNALNAFLPQTKKIGIIGMLKDKDSASSIKLLENTFQTLFTVPVSNPRTMTETELQENCLPYFEHVYAEKDPAEAFDSAFSLAAKQEAAVIICGSLYLAGEIRPYIIKKVNEK